jgi:hypothetical protein
MGTSLERSLEFYQQLGCTGFPVMVSSTGRMALDI